MLYWAPVLRTLHHDMHNVLEVCQIGQCPIGGKLQSPDLSSPLCARTRTINLGYLRALPLTDANKVRRVRQSIPIDVHEYALIVFPNIDKHLDNFIADFRIFLYSSLFF